MTKKHHDQSPEGGDDDVGGTGPQPVTASEVPLQYLGTVSDHPESTPRTPSDDAYPSCRLLRRGASALSDSELLSVLIDNRHGRQSPVDVARDLTAKFGGLAGVLNAEPQLLASVSGLRSPRTRAALAAVLELARRSILQQLQAREVFSSPGAVKSYLQLHLSHQLHEAFAVLFLDAQNRLIATEVMFRGTLTQTSVYPREIVVRALYHHAAAVVLAHNHPSGTVQPSRADELLTQTIKSALTLVDVRVLDHVIVAPGAALSMAERGLL
jgi:DNA repair protein RadC